MINMEAAKHTFKVVGTVIGISSASILSLLVLNTYFGIYGILSGVVIFAICLASKVVYELKKQEIEYKQRFNR
jgi:predicted PurR-regulated permease PerM